MKDNYHIIETDNQLKITITKKANLFILFLTGLWLINWSAMISIIIYGIITNPEKLDGEIIFILIMLFLAGLFVLKIFLWHLKGKEIVTINNCELIIKKTGTILTFSSKYNIDYIDTICNTEKSTTPKWIKNLGLGGGQIEFIYLEDRKYFGQSLNVSDASKIIRKIKEKIAFTKK